MEAPDTPSDGQEDTGSLGDRTLDCLLGVDKPDASAVQLAPPLSGPGKKDWDAYTHRAKPQSVTASAAAGGFATTCPRIPLCWSCSPTSSVGLSSAAVVIALLYLVWYGLVFFRVV